MFIADSSFLVSLFLPFDVNHEKAKKQFVEVKDKIFIPNIILYETLTVLTYKGSPEEKKFTYEKIKSNKNFIIDHLSSSELDEILEEFISSKRKISFEDHSIINIAKKGNLKILSFDKQIKS